MIRGERIGKQAGHIARQLPIFAWPHSESALEPGRRVACRRARGGDKRDNHDRLSQDRRADAAREKTSLVRITRSCAGAMSWVSERNLVSAISNGGGFGVIACGAMTPDLLDAEIAATRALTDRPFGVNLITMHPQLFDLIAVCERHGVTPCRSGRRHPAQGQRRRDQGGQQPGQGDLFCAHAGAGEEIAAVRRRCAS